MSRVSGIQIEKDSKGCPIYAHIDLKKHAKTLEYLKELGALEEDEFEHDWNRGLTPEQFKSEMRTRIKKWFDK